MKLIPPQDIFIILLSILVPIKGHCQSIELHAISALIKHTISPGRYEARPKPREISNYPVTATILYVAPQNTIYTFIIFILTINAGLLVSAILAL